MSDRYYVEQTNSWGLTIRDNKNPMDNSATKGRGEPTVVRGAIVAAWVDRGIAYRLCDFLNREEAS